MSRYSLKLELSDLNVERQMLTQESAMAVWPFNKWTRMGEGCLVADAVDDAEDLRKVADDIAKEVFIANDDYCNVAIYAFCLDTRQHEEPIIYSETEYSRMVGFKKETKSVT